MILAPNQPNMANTYHTYLIHIQYLGFRYSGWQTQPVQRTIEGMLSKTIRFILPDEPFKILGAGRTDAKVSSMDMALELFLENPVADTTSLLILLNQNLPPDIRAISIAPISGDFNIIKSSKTKKYVYLFSFGEKNHPYCAPFLANIHDNLNLAIMQRAALLFEGEHDFSSYTVKNKGNSKTIRNILSCELRENQVLTANFFPERSYALHIEGTGFLQYQIRLMMGALIQLGKGEIDLNDIEASLDPSNNIRFTYIAPGSGLHLHQLEFDFHGSGHFQK